MATAIESFLSRVYEVLHEAMSVTVERNRVDPFSKTELPAINIRRGHVDSTSFASETDRFTAEFELVIIVQSSSNSETELDELHQQAHQFLVADSVLQNLVRRLRVASIPKPEIVTNEYTFAEMPVAYSVDVLYQTINLNCRR